MLSIMPIAPTDSDGSANRVRIAISSPEILAHIRREFAGSGLIAQVDGLPTVEVVITGNPAGALDDTLHRLTGPESYRHDPATARFRLALAPQERRSAPRRRPTAYADTAPATVPDVSLSPREAEVLESLSRGLRNADIARALRVSEKTVKNHVTRIFIKLGVRSRVEAAMVWKAGESSRS
jgi:DNA-binding CsgD family transcriptional regulator